jgi:5-carboxymethyl-2-hydroxymuconate isomerase
MPHVIIEYSSNLEPALDIQGMVNDVHEAAIATGIAETAGIRTRAERRDVFRVADGNPANGFVHVVARLRVGRPEERRKALAQALLTAVERSLENAYKSHPIAVTVEIHEIDHMTLRRNTIRERSESAA